MNYKIYNEDCITGAGRHIQDECVDLLVCDPPFGIEETRASAGALIWGEMLGVVFVVGFVLGGAGYKAAAGEHDGALVYAAGGDCGIWGQLADGEEEQKEEC